MSLVKALDTLEDKFYNEFEEDRDLIMPELEVLHKEALAKGMDEFRAFAKEVLPRFGGAYIPHICWVELDAFIDNNDNRIYIHELIKVFVDSNFETIEKKMMKSLLITYYSLEKEFELSKIDSQTVSRAHKDVQEFFRKVSGFVTKNVTSVEMYVEKFMMLRKLYPDFELLRMPVMKLKQKLAIAE